jgi:formiminotetrahydrofolate cyclodeaminase
VYFYEAAARRPQCVNLERIRKGGFERLAAAMQTDPSRIPDIGDPVPHPSAGATVVGARRFLVAFNVNLTTADVGIAKKVAEAVRFSSGGFRSVKALGVLLGSRNIAQVTMNLTDFERTPVHRVVEAVRREAARYGVAVAGTEIVGLVPQKALELAAEFYLQADNYRPDVVLETRLAEALRTEAQIGGFLDAVAGKTPTPAGGSVAIAAASMGAALAEKVARVTGCDTAPFRGARLLLEAAISKDAEAFQRTFDAAAGEEAIRRATLIPLEAMESARSLKGHIATLKERAKPILRADADTAEAVVQGALIGLLAIVTANTALIKDAAFVEEVESRLRALK